MSQTTRLLPFFFGLCFLSLASCGKKSNDKTSVTATAVEKQEQEMERVDDMGVYEAAIMPLNESISGKLTGTVKIKILGDEFSVDQNIQGAPAGVRHLQVVLTGNTCPTIISDTNGDGVIDAVESSMVSGQRLIPLDSNLNSQIQGINFGPIANNEGRYVYRRSASFSKLLADLHSFDPDAFDQLVKLQVGDDLNLNGRVVMIYGVSDEASLPSTAASAPEETVQDSFPIACGEFVKIIEQEVVSR